MDAFWELGRSTIVEVQSRLPHLHTSMLSNTIGYLVVKGFVAKEEISRRRDGYFYTPMITKDSLMLRAVLCLLD